MVKRVLTPLLAAAALAACQPAVPDSGFGVGFDDTFRAQQANRDALLTGSSVPAPAPVTAAPLGSAQDTAAQTTAVLDATRPARSAGLGSQAAVNTGPLPLDASPSNPAPPLVNTSGISTENNFDAVSGQRSIEGDAARLASNRAQYTVVQPQALPERSSGGPNVVAYALATKHAPGTQIYRRVGLNKQAKFARACAAFSTADQAQIDFLSRGGPKKDRQGMDPDGDGFACAWDPTPYRRAAQG